VRTAVGRRLGDPEVWDDGLVRDAADRGAAVVVVVVATHDPEMVELAPGQVGGRVA
jgi:hypothetical protein